MNLRPLATASVLACLLASPPASTQDAAPSPTMHRLVAQALADGSRNRDAKGRQAANDLARAARVLSRTGAHPLQEGEPDLAKQWAAFAQSHGAKPDTTPPMRGRLLGPSYRRLSLAGKGSSETNQLFLAGQKALVTVVPVDGSALQLGVLQDDGTRYCERAVTKPHASCDWIPAATGRYRIVVSNSRTDAAEYFLIVN